MVASQSSAIYKAHLHSEDLCRKSFRESRHHVCGRDGDSKGTEDADGLVYKVFFPNSWLGRDPASGSESIAIGPVHSTLSTILLTIGCAGGLDAQATFGKRSPSGYPKE